MMNISRSLSNVLFVICAIFLLNTSVFAQEGKGALFAILSGGNELDSVTGEVVLNLTAPDSGSPGAVSDCIAEVDTKLLKKIFRNPANFYVNAHNPSFPAGAIRGQLH